MIQLSRPLIGPDECAAVERVLKSGLISQGPEVAAFEDEFSATVERHHCIAVNSGTSALHLGLLAAGIGPGDEVVVPSFTFAATANAVALCGATPVFVDIDPRSFCLDPLAVEAAITPATAAVMPVHLYGHPADMTALTQLAERFGLLVIEDAAQAHLAQFEGRPVGALGTVAAFSFYPTKNMTTGEGGMIVTADAEIAERARLLRNQGMARPYANEMIGFNCRMTDLAAAIGRVQLARLGQRTEARRANAALFDAALTAVEPPWVDERVQHVYHQYTVRCQDRDTITAALDEAQIQYGVYYPTPVHRLPAFDVDLDLVHTEQAAREVLSIPVRPDLSEQERQAIVEVLA